MSTKRGKPKGTKGDWIESKAALNNPFAALGTPSPVSDDAPVEPPKPVEVATPKRAVVRLERKGRGGKNVTLVSHLALPAEALESWCRELRKSLGCGGQVEDDTLVFHGDQRDRLASALEARGVGKVTRS
jgi:translation initiation factor 1